MKSLNIMMIVTLASVITDFSANVISSKGSQIVKLSRKLQDTNYAAIYEDNTVADDRTVDNQNLSDSDVTANINEDRQYIDIDGQNNPLVQDNSVAESNGIQGNSNDVVNDIAYTGSPEKSFDDLNQSDTYRDNNSTYDSQDNTNYYVEMTSNDANVLGNGENTGFVAENVANISPDYLNGLNDNSIQTPNSELPTGTIYFEQTADTDKHIDVPLTTANEDHIGSHTTHSAYGSPLEVQDHVNYFTNQPISHAYFENTPIIIINTPAPLVDTNMDTTAHVGTNNSQLSKDPSTTIKDVDIFYQRLDTVLDIYKRYAEALPKESTDKRTIAQQTADVIQFYDKVLGYIKNVENESDNLKNVIQSLRYTTDSLKTGELDVLVFYGVHGKYSQLKTKSKDYSTRDSEFDVYFKQITNTIFKFAGEIKKLKTGVSELLRLYETYMNDIGNLYQVAGPSSSFIGLEKYEKVIMYNGRLNDVQIQVDGSIKVMKASIMNLKTFKLEIERSLYNIEKAIGDHNEAQKSDQTLLHSDSKTSILITVVITMMTTIVL